MPTPAPDRKCPLAKDSIGARYRQSRRFGGSERPDSDLSMRHSASPKNEQARQFISTGESYQSYNFGLNNGANPDFPGQ